MPEYSEQLIAIGMVATIVYATRAGGYVLGLQLRRIAGIKPILEALPGCAFMAVLVPAARQGSIIEVIAMACVLILMWRTNNVVIATFTGVGVLLFGDLGLSIAGIEQ